MKLAAGSKIWHVPQDPPPDFITSVARWINEYQPLFESLSDQELHEPSKERIDEEDEAGMRRMRMSTDGQLGQLLELEQQLKPVEWTVQCVWKQAGQTGLFDFDEVYEMIGPLDEVKSGRSQCLLRPKLDEFLSRTLEINEIIDFLLPQIGLPTLRVNSPSSATKHFLSVKSLAQKKCSIWALLIGIDDYRQSPLQCAVADAEAMYDFLTQRLSVDKDHITKLLAPKNGNTSSPYYPTRQNILSNLWSLHQNDRIRHGDTIIVFYAGHGTVYSSSGVLRSGIRVEESDRDWSSFYRRNRIDFEELDDSPGGPFIDSIVSVDRGDPDPDPLYDGRKVPDICDRELNTIFTITRQKKGPNILFIADCCHSASVARNSPGVTKWRIRALPPLGRDDMEEMLLRAQWNVDHYIRRLEGPHVDVQSVMDVNWKSDLSSFVTLAACRRDQTSKEHFKQKNGLFTGVLLDTLESDAVDENTTFEGLIEQVGKRLSKWQVPVAHGNRKHLRLWFHKG